MIPPPKVSLALLAACLLATAVPRVAAAQNITIAGKPLPGPPYVISADLGKQVGTNLFHTFGQFSLSHTPTPESATFTSTGGTLPISNVISRVTGGSASSIDGAIISKITGANLYLINPSGIVFGPNATVNVSGSFHASTADYLKMSDGTKIPTGNPDSSTFSAAPPVAFGFLNASPAKISVNGSTLGPVPGTLGLVAGPVPITNGASLSAPAGTIHVTSVAGTGEVPVDPRNTAALTVTSFGPVDLKGGSKLDVSDPSGLGSGGSVFIRSGALTIEASEINGDDYGPGPSGMLVLRGDDQVTLSRAYVHAIGMGSGNGADVLISTAPTGVISADTDSSGLQPTVQLTASIANSGALTVSAGTLMLKKGATFENDYGPISVTANSMLLLDGAGANPGQPTGIFSSPSGVPSGPISIKAGELTVQNRAVVENTGGSIDVTAQQLTLANGGEIAIDTSFNPGGSISLAVAGQLTIDGSDPSRSTKINSSGAPPGDISITAGSLSIVNRGNGAEISATTTGASNGGNVSVSVGGALSIDGTVGNPAVLTGIAADASPGTGNAGSVTVSAGTLSIINNGVIGARTFGGGDGGSVSVNIAGQLSIDGTKGTPALSTTGIASDAVPGSAGNAGKVTVTAGTLSIISNGEISAQTFGPGNGGDISVSAGPLMINGISRNPGFVTGIASQAASRESTGNAGKVTITAGPMSIVNNGMISARTIGSGNGGEISVSAGQLTIDGTSGLAGIFAQSVLGTGNGGNVTINASGLSIDNNGQIISSTSGPGSGGNISVIVPGGEVLIDANAGTIPTGIFATASAGSTGTGGNVTISSGTLSILNGGLVSTERSGRGLTGSISVSVDQGLSINGNSAGGITGISAKSEPGSAMSAGNVVVGARTLSIGGGGQISASTQGSGTGGDVELMIADTTALTGGAQITAGTAGPGTGGSVKLTGLGALTLSDPGTGIIASASSAALGNAGSVTVTGPQITLARGAKISSTTEGTGSGGSVTVTTPGALVLNGAGNSNTQIAASAMGSHSGPGGAVTVAANALTVEGGAQIASSTAGPGKGGDVDVTIAGDVALSGTASDGMPSGITASARPGSSGQAGEVVLTAGGAIALSGGAQATSSTAGAGNGGTVQVTAQGPLTLTDPDSGIIASATSTASGNAGSVAVTAPQITLTTGAEVASTTAGTGAGGSVSVRTPGALVLDGAGVAGTQIAASAMGSHSGPGGAVTVAANSLTAEGGAQIASSTAGPGKGGDVDVTIANDVALSGIASDGTPSGITASARPGSSGQAGEVVLTAGGAIALSGGAQATSSTAGAGNGGTVQVTAQGPLSLTDPGSGIIASATSTASGNAGSVAVTAPQITLTTGAEVASTTAGIGAGGSVSVTTPGALVLDGAGVAGTQIAASATGPQSGAGGSVIVGADSLTIEGGARIAGTTAGPGKGGDIAVTIANGVTLSGVGPNSASGITASAEPGSSGQAGEVTLIAGGAIALSGGARVASSTAGAGDAGTVQVSSQGPLSLSDPGSGIIVSATSTASGNAGSVRVAAPQIALISGAEISSTTAGTGAGGSVNVTTPGALVLVGGDVGNTEIAASATGPQSGPGGSVTVAADTLSIEGGARIASTTFGPGKAGDIAVTIANGVTLLGQGPSGASGITASAQPGSSGPAGEVTLMAGGPIALSGGAKVTSSTGGAGNGGTVEVAAQGSLSLNDRGSGIIASATSTASGNAGSVMVTAPQITVTTGAEIASTTAGTGAGGSVDVTTPGALVLDGQGAAGTQIAASATGPQSGPGGSVTVAANSLTVEGGAQVASSTAGPGKGGDVNLIVASDIVLPDPGPQITAQSTGSGDAGSITVSALRLLMSNGGAISTEATTSTASGGNITLKVRDFLYLTSSEITTSVKGETGNGGNITIDPQLFILNHSSIIAEAIEGHGGNITINAGLFIPSSDSIVSATSELGISGTVEINGPRVDVNGALVVLSSELRGRAAVLREACAARAEQPISSLVEAGRGGLPQDPEATLPALYIAGRDVEGSPRTAGESTDLSGALPTTIHLTMRCG